MDWNTSTLWWLATGALVAAELATGTFYLLMLALGAAAAAVAAHLGLGSSAQLICAAIVGGGAVAVWHLKRDKTVEPTETNRAINLDIGSPVQVPHWGSDGTARVHFRGADWDARFAGGGVPQPGEHVIRSIDGSRLLLDRAVH